MRSRTSGTGRPGRPDDAAVARGPPTCSWQQNTEREVFYLTTHSTHFIYGYMEREREREREVFYLTTHSTHFIYGHMERERERSVLFNDALNTFYLRSYGEREKCFI